MRPAIVLATTIAAAALAGTAISLAQRPPAPRHPTIAASPDVSAIPPTNQPAVAFGFSVAPDLQRHQLVLFGGVGDFSNTWLWDGAAWSRAQPAMSPPGRYGASAAFDPQIGAVLLFGGILQTGQTANDTWAWDGRTWQEVDTGRDGPGGGAASAMAWDPSRSEMVLVAPSPGGGGGGGQTWTWSGTRWVHDRAGVLGTRDTGILMAFDPVSNALIAEGCCASPTVGTLGGVPSTWRWDGSAWSVLATSVRPPDGSSLGLDPSLRRLVLCGCDLAGGLAPRMWVWDGRDWMPGPYPRLPLAPEAEVVDPADSQFLVLGAAIGGVDALTQTVQVWAIRGTAWLRLGTGLHSG